MACFFFHFFCMCSLGIYICTESPFDVSYLSILSNKTHPLISVTHTMMFTRGKDYIRTYQNYEFEKRFFCKITKPNQGSFKPFKIFGMNDAIFVSCWSKIFLHLCGFLLLIFFSKIFLRCISAFYNIYAYDYRIVVDH